MSRILTYGALLICLLTGFSSASFAIDIQVVEARGGITAWLVEEHSLPLISLSVAWHGGSSMDPQGKSGLARMASALLDEGAGDMDSNEFQARLQDKAIRLRFTAGADTFSGTLRTLSEFSDEAFQLLGEAVNDPRFDEDAVERIRSQIIVGLRRQEQNPSHILSRTWQKAYFGDHPYARDTDGTLETIPTIQKADLESFVDNRLARDNLVIAVVGDVTADELKDLLNTAFGDLPRRSVPYILPPVEYPQTGQTIRVEKDVPQAVVRFGHHAILRDDPEWYIAYVMNYILGGGSFSSRLTDVVREQNGLAYGIGTGFGTYDYEGIFAGSVSTDRVSVDLSVQLIKQEINRMVEDGVTADELDGAKSYITGSYPLNFDTSGKIAGQLLGVQMEGLGLDYIDTRNTLIEAVTLEQVNAVAKKLLRPDELLWVIVGGPVEDAP